MNPTGQGQPDQFLAVTKFRAFTLIELLVVMAISAILAVMLLPAPDFGRQLVKPCKPEQKPDFTKCNSRITPAEIRITP